MVSCKRKKIGKEKTAAEASVILHACSCSSSSSSSSYDSETGTSKACYLYTVYYRKVQRQELVCLSVCGTAGQSEMNTISLYHTVCLKAQLGQTIFGR